MPASIPLLRLIQLSDTHLVGDNAPLGGLIDTDYWLEVALTKLRATKLKIDGLILAGDLIDDGSVEAHHRLRTKIDALASDLDLKLVSYHMGNHDQRAPFNQYLLDRPASTEPIDQVQWCGELRVIGLDSTVPQAGEGLLRPEQLSWLADQLATPAPLGTLLVIHHPPVPNSSAVMSRYQLANPTDLAETIAGSDVRLICSGHLHAAGFGTLAGVPVNISGPVCYAQDVLGMPNFVGVDGGRAMSLIEFFANQLSCQVVNLDSSKPLSELSN